MMLGVVQLHIRDYPYVKPNNEDDPWVWLPPAAVKHLSLEHGDDVLYRAVKCKGCWEADKIFNNLSKMERKSGLWQHGKIDAMFHGHVFIQPDLGPPNVMCMPSATDTGYKPYVGQEVEFRAGPSEKKTSKYLQAIHLREKDDPTAVEPVHGASMSQTDRMIEDSDTDFFNLQGVWIDYAND